MHSDDVGDDIWHGQVIGCPRMDSRTHYFHSIHQVPRTAARGCGMRRRGRRCGCWPTPPRGQSPQRWCCRGRRIWLPAPVPAVPAAARQRGDCSDPRPWRRSHGGMDCCLFEVAAAAAAAVTAAAHDSNHMLQGVQPCRQQRSFAWVRDAKAESAHLVLRRRYPTESKPWNGVPSLVDGSLPYRCVLYLPQNRA